MFNCIYCHKDLDGESPLTDPQGNDCCENCYDSKGFAIVDPDPLDEVNVDELPEF